MEASFFENPGKVFEEITEVKLPERKMLYRFTAPVRDDKGNIIGRIIVYRDISKELEIEQMKTEVFRLRAELETKYSFANIIGKSKKMRDMYALMQRAIESDITVLIQGESGTGKELVTKAIHFNSSRKTGPFIAVNCAAIPETLIESSLFGHERGALLEEAKVIQASGLPPEIRPVYKHFNSPMGGKIAPDLRNRVGDVLFSIIILLRSR